MAGTPQDMARELARLIRGEIEPRDFPWLSEKERRALGALGMSMLKSGKPDVAQAAFGVLIDLEPDAAVHHLSFGRAREIAAQDKRQAEAASEAFLARGDLLLRLGRMVEARADLADAAQRMSDPNRKRSIEAFLAT